MIPDDILDLSVCVAWDLGQAEIRMLAELSGDELLIKQLLSGDDIHSLVGHELTGWPVERIKKEKLVRKLVKNMIFGTCIAEDQMALTDRGEIPIQHVLPSDKVWDGEEFVPHEGLVFQGYQEVVKHDGIIATGSHEVWTPEGRQVAISEALAEGFPLLAASDRGSPRRLPETCIQHIRGYGREQEENLCGSSLHTLWENPDSLDRQYLSGPQPNPPKKTKGTVAVYDIMNAGPRRRFTVNGKLVSNCYGLGRDSLQPYIVGKIREVDGPDADVSTITVARCNQLYDAFFKKYKGVAQFIDKCRQQAMDQHFVETLFGFRREIRENDSRGTYWLNQAINSPVQGSAHTLILIALALLHLKPRTYSLLRKPVMEVHDALYFFVKLRDLPEAFKQGMALLQTDVIQYAERHWKRKIRVPFTAEASAGFTLGSLVSYSGECVEDFLPKWQNYFKEVESRPHKVL